ncbi:MAG TPA: hypothetical protein VD978_13675 [Azospirillum sp.]|nr:hypothetical protein [Azospirillum sp.]
MESDLRDDLRDEDAAAVCETYASVRQRMDELPSIEIAVEVLRTRQKSLDIAAAWTKAMWALARAGLLKGEPRSAA